MSDETIPQVTEGDMLFVASYPSTSPQASEDDTIPQTSEGVEILTASLGPRFRFRVSDLVPPQEGGGGQSGTPSPEPTQSE